MKPSSNLKHELLTYLKQKINCISEDDLLKIEYAIANTLCNCINNRDEVVSKIRNLLIDVATSEKVSLLDIRNTKKNIYFAGSIRGGQADTALYHKIIEYIKQTDTVLTEQVGDVYHSAKEGSFRDDARIYEQDTAWLRQCDMVIAECTTPSLGVGYELAYAEKLNKPVHIFYEVSRGPLSAMLTGDPYYRIHAYDSEQSLFAAVDAALEAI